MDVRLEDGTIVRNVPDGTTKEQLAARLNAAGMTPSARRGEDQEQRLRALNYGGSDRRLAGSIARGALDTIGGGAQLLSRGASALGLVSESTGDAFWAGPSEVESQNAGMHRSLDRRFGAPEPGFDLARSGTAAALTMPLAPTKFLQAPTWIQRAAGAGTAGAVGGSLQEVPQPKDSKDFWKQKAAQTGAGFAAGAVAQPIAENVVKAVVAGFNRTAEKGTAAARNITGANSMEHLVAMTREALKRSGLEYDALSEAAKQGLLDDVQKALSKYSGTKPGAIARQAAFREEGFDPLRHWVSRDPSEFTWFENVAGVQGVGDPLKQRKADLDKFALDRLNQMRGQASSPDAVGAAGQRDLRGYLSQERGKTNVLYRTFQEIAPDVRGEPQRFVNRLFDGLEGEFAGASLPSSLREIVNKISKGEVPLTPSTLYQLQKMANSARGSDGSVNYALGHLSRAIDSELDAISRGIAGLDRSKPTVAGQVVQPKEGAHAADVLKMARGQHAKISRELEESRLLQAADDGKPVESFTESLMGTSVKDLGASWIKLGNDSKEMVRAQVLDELKRKAFGGATDDAGKAAAQAAFNNYINEPTTRQKLQIILGTQRYEQVKRLGVMLESAHLAPSGSKVNTSNTGASLVSFGTRVGDAMVAKGIPGGRFAQDSFRRGAVQSALVPDPSALGTQSLVIDPMMEELLKRRVGYGAGLLGGVGAYPGLLDLVAPDTPR